MSSKLSDEIKRSRFGKAKVNAEKGKPIEGKIYKQSKICNDAQDQNQWSGMQETLESFSPNGSKKNISRDRTNNINGNDIESRDSRRSTRYSDESSKDSRRRSKDIEVSARPNSNYRRRRSRNSSSRDSRDFHECSRNKIERNRKERDSSESHAEVLKHKDSESGRVSRRSQEQFRLKDKIDSSDNVISSGHHSTNYFNSNKTYHGRYQSQSPEPLKYRPFTEDKADSQLLPSNVRKGSVGNSPDPSRYVPPKNDDSYSFEKNDDSETRTRSSIDKRISRGRSSEKISKEVHKSAQKYSHDESPEPSQYIPRNFDEMNSFEKCDNKSENRIQDSKNRKETASRDSRELSTGSRQKYEEYGIQTRDLGIKKESRERSYDSRKDQKSQRSNENFDTSREIRSRDVQHHKDFRDPNKVSRDKSDKYEIQTCDLTDRGKHDNHLKDRSRSKDRYSKGKTNSIRADSKGEIKGEREKSISTRESRARRSHDEATATPEKSRHRIIDRSSERQLQLEQHPSKERKSRHDRQGSREKIDVSPRKAGFDRERPVDRDMYKWTDTSRGGRGGIRGGRRWHDEPDREGRGRGFGSRFPHQDTTLSPSKSSFKTAFGTTIVQTPAGSGVGSLTGVVQGGLSTPHFGPGYGARGPPPLGHPAWANPEFWGPPASYWGHMGPPPPGHPAWYEAMGVPLPPGHPALGGPNIPGWSRRGRKRDFEHMDHISEPGKDEPTKKQEIEGAEQGGAGGITVAAVLLEEKKEGTEPSVTLDIDAMPSFDFDAALSPPKKSELKTFFFLVRSKIENRKYEDYALFRANGDIRTAGLLFRNDGFEMDNAEIGLVDAMSKIEVGTPEVEPDTKMSTKEPTEVKELDHLEVQVEKAEVEADDLYGDLYGDLDKVEHETDGLYDDLETDIPPSKSRDTEKSQISTSRAGLVAQISAQPDATRLMMATLRRLEGKLVVPSYSGFINEIGTARGVDLVEEAISVLQGGSY